MTPVYSGQIHNVDNGYEEGEGKGPVGEGKCVLSGRTITDLPPEIGSIIVRKLPFADILSLEQANSNFWGHSATYWESERKMQNLDLTFAISDSPGEREKYLLAKAAIKLAIEIAPLSEITSPEAREIERKNEWLKAPFPRLHSLLLSAIYQKEHPHETTNPFSGLTAKDIDLINEGASQDNLGDIILQGLLEREPQKTEEHLKVAFERNTFFNSSASIVRARNLILNNELNEAEKLLNEVIQKSEPNIPADALLLMGCLKMLKRDFANANDYYLRALSTSKPAITENSVRDCLIKLKAESGLSKTLLTNSFYMWFSAAEVFIKFEKWEEADSILRLCAKCNYEGLDDELASQIFLSAAFVKANLGQMEEAEALFSQKRLVPSGNEERAAFVEEKLAEYKASQQAT